MTSVEDKDIYRLDNARAWRTYQGGAKIEQFLFESSQLYTNNEVTEVNDVLAKEFQDSHFPELWIASIVEARNSNREAFKGEGLSYILDDNGNKQQLLRDLIESAPEKYLGPKHYATHGASLGLLLKLLDSKDRLSIQVHPDKEKARKYFNSSYGKTEAWYILDGREIDGEKAHIYFGFKPGVTAEIWEEVFTSQDISRMLSMLHKIYVQPGDVFYIEGGTPHAIGAGCFLMEIQEPTDFTLYAEKTNASGVRIADETIHQGIGFEKMLQCFHYDAYDLEKTLDKWKIDPEITQLSEKNLKSSLLPSNVTDSFRMEYYQLEEDYTIEKSENFSVLFILDGSGIITFPNGNHLEVQKGQQYFVPYYTTKLKVSPIKNSPLKLIEAHVPLA